MNKCACNGCKKKLNTLSFTCKWCSKSYCLKHQLPETHLCSSFSRGTVSLQQIVPPKIQKI